MHLLQFSGFFAAILMTAIAQFYNPISWQTVSVLEGNGIMFFCSGSVVDWFVTKTFKDQPTIAQFYSSITSDNEITGRYGCAGDFQLVPENNDGVCAYDISVNYDTGSPMTLTRSTFKTAATYGCHLTSSSNTNQMQLFNLTVVSSVYPALTYTVDGMTYRSTPSGSLLINYGISITLNCSITYAGFNAPILQLWRTDNNGDTLLQASPLTINPTLIVPSTVSLSATYNVQPSDSTFALWCNALDVTTATPAFQGFQVIETTTPHTTTDPLAFLNSQHSSTRLSEGVIIGTAFRVLLGVMSILVVYL